MDLINIFLVPQQKMRTMGGLKSNVKSWEQLVCLTRVRGYLFSPWMSDATFE